MVYPKCAGGKANSVDPDQEQSHLGLHFLLRPVFPISSADHSKFAILGNKNAVPSGQKLC